MVMSIPPSGPPPPYHGAPYHYWSHGRYPPPPHFGPGGRRPHVDFGTGSHVDFGPDGPQVGPGGRPPHVDFGTGSHVDFGPDGPQVGPPKSGYGWHPPAHCTGSFTWMEGRSGSVPPNAVKVGVDKDGSPIFAGRAFHEGDLLPAKISPSHGGAFVAWGGGEHSKFEYEVLCSTNVGWTSAARGEVPPEAISVGQTSEGEKLYLGRVMHEGTLTPGKIQPSHGVLYIPYGGREVSFPEYEVMVLM